MGALKSGLLTKCAGCGRKTAHENIHQEKGLRHLRCETCWFIDIFAVDATASGTPGPLGFDDVVKQVESEAVATYSAGTAYFVSDLIDHTKFALGYVVAIQEPPKKMEILFGDKRRILLCGPGSGVVPAAKEDPSRTKRARSAGGRKKPVAQVSSTQDDHEPARAPGPEVSSPCPKCGFISHPFNLRRNPADQIVGCMRCL